MSMLITRLWYEKQCNQYQINYSNWVLKESDHSQVWKANQRLVRMLIAAMPLAWQVVRLSESGFHLSVSSVKFLRLWNILGTDGEYGLK